MIRLTNVTIAHQGLQILHNASFHIKPGEVVLLTGQTGSGKTSLIRAMYGDLKVSGGSIEINSTNLTGLPSRKLPALRRTMGIIFQDDKLLEDRSVYDNIRFALSIQMKAQRDINRRALEILAELGLSHLRSMMPQTLSGGEAQRIGVARALANNPSLVLADEPTGDLDPTTATEIFEYLASHQSPNRAFLIATHDLNRASQAFPNAHLFHLEHGKLIPNN